MSSAEPGAATAPPLAAIPATPIEERHRALLEDLTAKLGDGVVGSQQRTGDLWVRVRAADWLRAAEELRAMGFDYLCYLSGIDWLPATWPNPKVIEGPEGEGTGVVDADDEAALPVDESAVEEPGPEAPAPGDGITTGFAGGDTRFQVLARLYSTTRKLGVNLKADLDDEAPHVGTWISVFPGADWCERETWEMYGFQFDGHPNLVHLYLPGEFEGYPLRKDFPLLAREVKPWPGLVDVEPMPEAPGAPAEAVADAEAGAGA